MGKVLFMRKGSKHTAPKQGLPTAYTRLAYIQSTGTQYVDSKFVPNQDTRVVVDMNVSQSNNQQGLFGARDGSIYFELFTYTATNGYQDDYGSTQKYPVGAINYGRHILDKNKNVFSVDGIAVNTITATTFSISYSVFLLSINKDGSAYAAVPTTAKLYSCQIYDNGTLVRDFVPCINPSGTVGLYDLVGKKFYGNAGTGTFTGSEVA